MKKKVLAVFLTLALCSTCAAPVIASEGTGAVTESGIENEIAGYTGEESVPAENDLSDFAVSEPEEASSIYDDIYSDDETGYITEDDADVENLIPDASFGGGSASGSESDISEKTTYDEVYAEEAGSDIQNTDADRNVNTVPSTDTEKDPDSDMIESFEGDPKDEEIPENEPEEQALNEGMLGIT